MLGGWCFEDEDHLEELGTAVKEEAPYLFIGSPPREACAPLLRIPQRRPKDEEQNAHRDGSRYHLGVTLLLLPVPQSMCSLCPHLHDSRLSARSSSLAQASDSGRESSLPCPSIPSRERLVQFLL